MKAIVVAASLLLVMTAMAQAHELPCKAAYSQSHKSQDCHARDSHRVWHTSHGHCRTVKVWNEYERHVEYGCAR